MLPNSGDIYDKFCQGESGDFPNRINSDWQIKNKIKNITGVLVGIFFLLERMAAAVL